MTKNNFKILKSFWFIIALIVLLLNDFLLKSLFSNWLTGKLSDIAGLFIFPLFWISLFPKYKIYIYLLTAAFFTFWKSIYSEFYINYWNEITGFTIYRIVDYVDLIALGILPVSYYYEKSLIKSSILKVNPVYPGLVAIFAFTATSYHTDIPINKNYLFNFPRNIFEQRISSIEGLNSGYGVKLSDRNPDTLNITIPFDLCFNRFEATIVVQELTNGKTLVRLINAHHSCPKGKNDKEKAILGFEEKVVNKLNNF